MSRSIRSTQRGLSIIELLIALAISSLLILGVTQIYVDNKSNYFFQQAQSDNTENSRYTLLVLEEELRRVGYRTRPGIDFPEAFPAGGDGGNCAFPAGETINFNPANSRLCLRYKPHIPGLTACDGRAQPGPGDFPYSNPRYVDDIIVDLTFTGTSLLCNDQPVFDNLVDLRFEFGENTGNFGRSVQEYSDVLDPERVRSVRYAALVRSRYDNVATDNQSQAFEYWNETFLDTEGATAPDRALYMVTENTITLRNLAE